MASASVAYYVTYAIKTLGFARDNVDILLGLAAYLRQYALARPGNTPYGTKVTC